MFLKSCSTPAAAPEPVAGWYEGTLYEDKPFYITKNAISWTSGRKKADFGRWTTLPYTLLGDDREAIAYAQPLILDDGTVYGVLGIEMLESYMDTKLPWDELQNDNHGSYLLASKIGRAHV